MEKDVVQIRCLSDNERYADLINGIVFRGRRVVRGDDLLEMDSQTGVWKAFPGKRMRKAGKKYRDLIRKVAMGVNFTVIGVENQDKVHYLMPLRTMGYDVAEYERQASYIRKKIRKDGKSSDAEFLSGFKKTSRLYPCVTLVIFYGKDWDGSKDLHGLLDFIRCSEDRNELRKLVQGDSTYQNMDEDAYDMAVAYTDASELIAVKEINRKDGKVNMCKALTELIEEGREEGRQEGIRGMILDNLEQGILKEQIVEKLCRYFGMNSDRAQEYVEKVKESNA